jgi:hypothetical protein
LKYFEACLRVSLRQYLYVLFFERSANQLKILGTVIDGKHSKAFRLTHSVLPLRDSPWRAQEKTGRDTKTGKKYSGVSPETEAAKVGASSTLLELGIALLPAT